MAAASDRFGIGVDSNILTYLVEAMTSGYDPAKDDNPSLRSERVAAVRVFLYVGDLFIPATVGLEANGISGSERRSYHEMLQKVLVAELVNLDDDEVDRRAGDFERFHSGRGDCRIVAESEVGGLAYLLTFDEDMKRNLDDLTPVSIKTATEYWDSTGIQTGVDPRWKPHAENWLADQDWWRW